MPLAFLLAALAEVPDPRRAQGQRYSVGHLLLFAVLAVLTGATPFKKIRPYVAAATGEIGLVLGS